MIVEVGDKVRTQKVGVERIGVVGEIYGGSVLYTEEDGFLGDVEEVVEILEKAGRTLKVGDRVTGGDLDRFGTGDYIVRTPGNGLYLYCSVFPGKFSTLHHQAERRDNSDIGDSFTIEWGSDLYEL